MTQTKDQQQATAQLRALPDVIEGRFRVNPDDEGWPVIPGRYGRIEYHGEVHDSRTLAVHTERPRLFAKLLAVPGVRRHQMGGPRGGCCSSPRPCPGWPR